MMKKFFFSVITILITASVFAQQKFSFVFMSDIHYTSEFGAPKAFQMVVDTVNKMKPDFVLVGGDIVYDALRETESTAVSYAKEYLKAAEKIKAPKYYAVGNHDNLQLYEKKADTAAKLFNKRFYEHFFGKRYYSFDHKGWHFISLDDIFITEDRNYIGKVDDEQIKWIKDDIRKVDASTPIVLMVHVPLISTLSQWYGGGTNANKNKIAAEDSDKVLSLFKKHNLKLILQGHLHYFEALNIANKTTVITAPSVSGRWWRGKQNEVEEGFIKINVNGNNFSYDYIDYGWEAPARKSGSSDSIPN